MRPLISDIAIFTIKKLQWSDKYNSTRLYTYLVLEEVLKGKVVTQWSLIISSWAVIIVIIRQPYTSWRLKEQHICHLRKIIWMTKKNVQLNSLLIIAFANSARIRSEIISEST